jgi:hypothetical protein
MPECTDTLTTALLTLLGTFLGASAATIGLIWSKIIEHKTEKLKLTFKEKGNSLYLIISFCDKLLSDHDPTEIPNYRHLLEYVPMLSEIKKYYYLLPKSIIDSIETLHTNFNDINFIGHEYLDMKDLEHFFESELRDKLHELKQAALGEFK